MSTATRRFARILILALVAASLSACHFCGHGFHPHAHAHWGWGHGHAVRHCR